MRKGVSFTVSSADGRRLREVMSDGNSPQKQVWRAHIVLLSAAGLGTTAIMMGDRQVEDLRLALVRNASCAKA